MGQDAPPKSDDLSANIVLCSTLWKEHAEASRLSPDLRRHAAACVQSPLTQY